MLQNLPSSNLAPSPLNPPTLPKFSLKDRAPRPNRYNRDLFRRFFPFHFSERTTCEDDDNGDKGEVETMDGLMTTSLPPHQILAAVTSTAAETSPSSNNRQLSRQSSRESGVSDASSNR